MKYCINNGKIITPEKVINGNIYIKNGKILKIEEGNKKNQNKEYKNIEAQGKWIMPGIIDCHSDAIEIALQPRPTSLFNIEIAFTELEKNLIASGITTMYHSLATSKAIYLEDKVQKYCRTPKGVEELSNYIYSKKNKSLINHKLHIRYEVDNIDGTDQIKKLIDEKKINQLSIMDHTPGQGQFRNLEKYKKVVATYKNCNETEAEKSIIEAMKKEKMSTEEIKDIVDYARKNNITVASHDDDIKEKIDLITSWNIKISEFPINLEVAKYAKEKGMYTVMGAPNILLGGSHSGNLSAEIAINNKVVDILCSDYYPSSIIYSIFYMYNKGKKIEDMVKLATINPAKALNIDNITGSIEEGKNADILIIEEKNNLPILNKVFSFGKIIMSIGGEEC